MEPCGHYTEPPIRWPATNAQRMKGLLLKDTVAPLCSAQLPVNDGDTSNAHTHTFNSLVLVRVLSYLGVNCKGDERK